MRIHSSYLHNVTHNVALKVSGRGGSVDVG